MVPATAPTTPAPALRKRSGSGVGGGEGGGVGAFVGALEGGACLVGATDGRGVGDRVTVTAATLESSTATDTESAEAAADSKPLEVISETRAVESSSVVETPLRSSRDAVSVKDTDHV